MQMFFFSVFRSAFDDCFHFSRKKEISLHATAFALNDRRKNNPTLTFDSLIGRAFPTRIPENNQRMLLTKQSAAAVSRLLLLCLRRSINQQKQQQSLFRPPPSCPETLLRDDFSHIISSTIDRCFV